MVKKIRKSAMPGGGKDPVFSQVLQQIESEPVPPVLTDLARELEDRLKAQGVTKTDGSDS